jgi:hypothetical protein
MHNLRTKCEKEKVKNTSMDRLPLWIEMRGERLNDNQKLH